MSERKFARLAARTRELTPGEMRSLLDTSLELGKRATALRNVPNTLVIFETHFPRFPVMPGVLILAWLVGWYVVRISNPDQATAIAKAIDSQFANSPSETRTQTESAFAAAFVPTTIALLAVEMKLLAGRMQADLWYFPERTT